MSDFDFESPFSANVSDETHSLRLSTPEEREVASLYGDWEVVWAGTISGALGPKDDALHISVDPIESKVTLREPGRPLPTWSLRRYLQTSQSGQDEVYRMEITVNRHDEEASKGDMEVWRAKQFTISSDGKYAQLLESSFDRVVGGRRLGRERPEGSRGPLNAERIAELSETKDALVAKLHPQESVPRTATNSRRRRFGLGRIAIKNRE